MARDDRRGGAAGGAWWGEAPGRCVVLTGLRLLCGHRLSTRRREIFDCLSRPKTKADGDREAAYAALKLGRHLNSRCGERFVAKNFIGRAARYDACMRSGSRRRFRRALWGARHGRPELLNFARSARSRGAIRANCGGVGGQISLDQPSRQQGVAAFIHPNVEELRDFFSQVCCEIQSRLFVRLKRRFRRTQQKFPIYFVLRVLAHGNDPPNEWSTLPFY